MERYSKININKFAQNIIDINTLFEFFAHKKVKEKRIFLREFVYYFLIQSKPENVDVERAIIDSSLKTTYTCCVLLKKFGVNKIGLEKILELPENELGKAFVLLLNLYKIAYNRKYLEEKNNPDKWWFWDLRDVQNLKRLEEMNI
ncbi:DUF5958 family protein [Sinomicrobium sp. M5D2P9]